MQNVKIRCEIKGIKPTVACKESGVGGSFISDIKRGQTPSVAKVQIFANYLGVTISELVGEVPMGTYSRLVVSADEGELSSAELELLSAYRVASPDDRAIIDNIVRRYIQDAATKNPA